MKRMVAVMDMAMMMCMWVMSMCMRCNAIISERFQAVS